jgi:Leucine-rich repeat (LRR) protein
MMTQASRSALPPFVSSSTALKSLNSNPETVCLKSVRVGERGLNTRRSAAFSAPESVTRKRQLTILTAAPNSLALIGT